MRGFIPYEWEIALELTKDEPPPPALARFPQKTCRAALALSLLKTRSAFGEHPTLVILAKRLPLNADVIRR